MRKKLFIAAAVILLLLLCFFGWLQYRQYSSWKIPVHKDIKTVARINTDDLIGDFIKEYGISFSKKVRKKETRESDSTKNTGVYFPGNIFIYNISSREPSALFCSLPVYNMADLKTYLRARFNIQLSDSAGFSKGNSSDGKFSIVCNEKYICIGYSMLKEELTGILMEILSGNNTLAQHTAITTKLKEAKTVYASTNGLYSVTLDMDGKKLLLHASFGYPKNIQIPEFPKRQAPAPSFTASVSANFYPIASLFKPKYNIKQYSIETDSLLKYYDGYTGLSIGPATTQADTITTYEYDDSFEKVEKQTIQEVKVPALNLAVMVKPGMLVYLQQQQFITADMKLNKEIFPLYNINLSRQNGLLVFSTNNDNNIQQSRFATSSHFIECTIDVNKTVEALSIPFLQPYIHNIQSFQLAGKKVNGQIVMDATLDFEHAAIKDIVAIFKSL